MLLEEQKQIEKAKKTYKKPFFYGLVIGIFVLEKFPKHLVSLEIAHGLELFLLVTLSFMILEILLEIYKKIEGDEKNVTINSEKHKALVIEAINETFKNEAKRVKAAGINDYLPHLSEKKDLKNLVQDALSHIGKDPYSKKSSPRLIIRASCKTKKRE